MESLYRLLSTNTGKLSIPANIKYIKLDIGLSYGAPYSQLWLSRLSPDRIVFGFEPNRKSIQCIKTGKGFEHFPYPRINTQYIDDRFFLIECALDDETGIKKLYMTDNDPGTSSLYKPTCFGVEEVIEIPCIRLRNFFEMIPWDRFEFVEHIKVDTQANDLRILMSGDEYIRNRVVYITIECGNEKAQYQCDKEYSGYTREDIYKYMNDNGFELCSTPVYSLDGEMRLLSSNHNHRYNLTFVNKRFKDIAISAGLDCSLLLE